MSNLDDKNNMINRAVEYINSTLKPKVSEKYIEESSEDTSEMSTDELVNNAKKQHWTDKFSHAALKRPDITKSHLTDLFKNTGAYRNVINHPLVDKKMMHDFVDHAHKNFKNDLAKKAVAHKGKEMGVKHPLIDQLDKGEIKPNKLDLGSGPEKDYRNKPSGNWTGD